MPFDCTPITEPKQISAAAADGVEIGIIARSTGVVRSRPIPPWYVSRQPGSRDAAVAVLARARDLISDEQRWCKGSYAATWLDIPVLVGSRFARRFCALGAIKRAGRELLLSVDDACRALEWQTIRPVADWNDDRLRTHAEVIGGFDAAIAALDAVPATSLRL
jgi:hypothetical protein